jgi:UDP-N-acetylmuramate--alanine ligase
MSEDSTIAALQLPTAGASVFFIGIGGIGMSAIARYFNNNGITVTGYDKTETLLTKQLVAEGIGVHYQDSIEFIDRKAALIVYTPAVPKDHQQLNWYRDNSYTVVKRSDVLGAITNTAFNICVAGTHGKTTTSTMVAHILQHTGFGCNAFLGGIAANYNSNFWAAPKNADGSSNNTSVVEADEYDRSFLKLNPDIAIVTAMDPDHLDIYGTAENVERAFVDFTKRVKPQGCLLVKHGLKRHKEFTTTDICTYSATDAAANIHIDQLRMYNGAYIFDVVNNYWIIKNVELPMGGMHNVENVLAAIGVAKYLKIADDKIKAAISSFKGVKRRFEYIVKTTAQVYIDDYAHHPDELRALLSGAKSLFPDKKCTIIFQPHLYSRTNDFADGFAATLDIADEIILLPIYPARELPMPGVTSEMIMERMKNKNKSVKTKDELLAWIKTNAQELLITAGAGDIDNLVTPIKTILTEA